MDDLWIMVVLTKRYNESQEYIHFHRELHSGEIYVSVLFTKCAMFLLRTRNVAIIAKDVKFDLCFHIYNVKE